MLSKSKPSNDSADELAHDALVHWTARLGAVTAEALAESARLSVPSARARLSGAERRGLVRGWRPLVDQPRLFTATRAGLRAVGCTELAPATVSASNTRHSVVCAAVAATLERAYPHALLIGEPELRSHRRELCVAIGALRSRAPGAEGAARSHRPDLALCSREALSCPLAVEVELTVKAPRRLLEICLAWARCRSVCGVLYLAAPEVLQPLSRAIDRARAHERIAVARLELGDGGAVGVALGS
jgi:hypothetical protein